MNKISLEYFLAFGLIGLFLMNQGCSKNNPTGPNGGSWNEATANASWSPRYGMGGAVFNNEMWVVGGAWGISGSVTNYYGGVYNSSNGSQWNQTVGDSNTSHFGERYSPGVLSFVNKLWVIGGNQNGTLKNDVWNSSDGSNWTPVITSPLFTPREDFISIVYNNSIYIIGGWDGKPEADIWTTPDGTNWTQVIPVVNTGAVANYTLGFTPRWGSAATVFNGKIWILEGDGGNPYTVSTLAGSSNGDAWTFDGTTLTLVGLGSDLGSLPYPMLYHQVTANNGLLWLTPGSAPGALTYDGYYTSSDGINWSGSASPYLPRCGHVALSYNSHDWVMGGYNNQCWTPPNCPITYYNDVWSTN